MNSFKKLFVVITLFVFCAEPVAYNASSIILLQSELNNSEVESEQSELKVSEETAAKETEEISDQKEIKNVKASNEILGLSAIAIKQGDSYDLAQGVTVNGVAWSKLTGAEIKYGSSVITNTSTLPVGQNNLWYSYNGSRTQRVVTVKAKDVAPATAPTISGIDNKTIAMKSNFDAKSGVTAKASNGTDLTNSIIVTGTTVDTNYGNRDYTLTYKVTDTVSNLTTTKTRKIHVNNYLNLKASDGTLYREFYEGKVLTSRYYYYGTKYDNNKKKEVRSYYANGNLKTIYKYNTSGYYTEIRSYTDKKVITDYKAYDGKGFKTADYNYHPNGKHKAKYAYYKTGTYKYSRNNYNTSGVLTTSSRYYRSGGKAQYIKEYYSNGKVKRARYYNNKGKYTRIDTWNSKGSRTDYKKYDGKGHKTADYNYYSNGKVKTKYFYYTNGKYKEIREYYSDGKTKRVRKYNSSGKRTYNKTYKSTTKATDSKQSTNPEEEVLSIVNAERKKAGIAPLKLDPQLTEIAYLKSKDMGDKNYLSHYSPTYGWPNEMADQYNISYVTIGENIAAGQPTPALVMKDWMNSPGHRENILTAEYGKIGIGVYEKNGVKFWTQIFTD